MSEEITIKDLIDNYDIIKFLNEATIEDIDFVYEFSMTMDKIDQVVKSYEKSKNNLLVTLGDPDPQVQGQYLIPMDKYKSYKTELEKLDSKDLAFKLPQLDYDKVKTLIKTPKLLKSGIILNIIKKKEVEA